MPGQEVAQHPALPRIIGRPLKLELTPSPIPTTEAKHSVAQRRLQLLFQSVLR